VASISQLWASGVATFPQGFVRGVNPSATTNEPSKSPGARGATCGCGWTPCCHGHPTSQGLAHGRGLPSSVSCSGGDMPRGCRDLNPSPHCTPFPAAPHSHQSLVIQPIPTSPLSPRSVTPLLTHRPSCPLSASSPDHLSHSLSPASQPQAPHTPGQGLRSQSPFHTEEQQAALS